MPGRGCSRLTGSPVSELWFVGGGLGDELDLSRRALRLLGQCGAVFAEEYTSVFRPGTLERLSKEIGRPIDVLERSDAEDGRRVLAALDRSPRVALLVPGDPFAATTHLALRRLAEEHGHAWRYLPGASITSAAAGFLGLMVYRFGRVSSLPFAEPGFAPRSPLDIIRANRRHDLHTLVLLDLRPSEQRFMTAREAIGILQERDRRPRLFGPSVEIAVVARLGTDGAAAWFGALPALAAVEFGPPLHALVVPARSLHFEEAAALERVRVGPTRPAGSPNRALRPNAAAGRAPRGSPPRARRGPGASRRRGSARTPARSE